MIELAVTLLVLLAYFAGFLVTLWGIGRFCSMSYSRGSDYEERSDFLVAVVASFVWPLFLAGVAVVVFLHSSCALTAWVWEKGTRRSL